MRVLMISLIVFTFDNPELGRCLIPHMRTQVTFSVCLGTRFEGGDIILRHLRGHASAGMEETLVHPQVTRGEGGVLWGA